MMNLFFTKAAVVAGMLVALFFTSCTCDELAGGGNPDNATEVVAALLEMRAASVQVIGMQMTNDGAPAAPVTRVAEEPDELESCINNVWVFQFDAEGNPIGAPRFYAVQTTADKEKSVQLMLRACKQSQIYIVANTNDPTWGAGKDRLTLAQLREQTLAFTSEQNVYGDDLRNLPMAACLSQQDIIAGSANRLSITLDNLLAKVCFSYTLGSEVQDQLHVTGVRLYNIPDRVKLGANSGKYPPEDNFNSLESGYGELSNPVAGRESVYTWYVPENLQGKVDNDNPVNKNELAPRNAFYIRLFVDSDMDGGSYAYTVYPGGNTTDDFNVKRGNCYNVHVNINTATTDDRVLATPANCFVMREGASLVFDPYDRSETGGGWRYSDYVNKNNPDLRIERVDVLWQTKYKSKLAIGDNAQSDKLVYLDERDRVHVTAGGEGNAVIAAYNSKNVILWSWHIWVNNSSPAQQSEAVLYKTYQWDANRIYGEDSGKERVDGYPFMSCNLGAMNNEVGNPLSMGLFYQWGRKDPFPQTSEYVDLFRSYTNGNMVIQVYDASGNEIPIEATEEQEEGLFNSVKTDERRGTITYAIQHPTTFIAATETVNMWGKLNQMNPGFENEESYINNGGWYWVENENYDNSDRLWGGEPFGAPGQTVLTLNGTQIVANNGAHPNNKSIFDPCPAGWILPAADAWMGFTRDGLNRSGNQNNLNYTDTPDHGLQLYMEAWKSGKTLHFPFQGLRLADGSIGRCGSCGSYYTSAASAGGSAYVLHIHISWIYPYDFTYYGYSRRADAAAVRCVRTNK